MSVFQKAPEAVVEMANVLLNQYEDYAAILAAKVKIDILMAFPSEDAAGNLTGDALTLNGYRALGLTKIIPPDMRVNGAGDVMIKIDGNWWESASDALRKGLLDHELFHIQVTVKKGCVETDDGGRPKLTLRKHDYQFGWFRAIAARHKEFSVECVQAGEIREESGQLFWPELFGEDGLRNPSTPDQLAKAIDAHNATPLSDYQVSIETAGKIVTMTGDQFANAAKRVAKQAV